MSKPNKPPEMSKFECVNAIMTHIMALLPKAKPEERSEICDEVTGEIERLPREHKKAG